MQWKLSRYADILYDPFLASTASFADPSTLPRGVPGDIVVVGVSQGGIVDDGDGVSAASASDTPSELMNEEDPCYDEDKVRYNENCQDMLTSSTIPSSLPPQVLPILPHSRGAFRAILSSLEFYRGALWMMGMGFPPLAPPIRPPNS